MAFTATQAEDKTVKLSTGIAVTVEIKTGKRRVIECFRGPLLQVCGKGEGMNQMNREGMDMQQMSVFESRRWRYGDGLRERLLLLRSVGNRGLSPVVLPALNGGVDIESRRWRDCERSLRATNDMAWRRAA